MYTKINLVRGSKCLVVVYLPVQKRIALSLNDHVSQGCLGVLLDLGDRSGAFVQLLLLLLSCIHFYLRPQLKLYLG